jgi:hypothetical protein
LVFFRIAEATRILKWGTWMYNFGMVQKKWMYNFVQRPVRSSKYGQTSLPVIFAGTYLSTSKSHW